MLDVKATAWHEEYNKYRSGVKDLEVMLQNVINAGFANITTVQEGVELLDVFTQFISREVQYYILLLQHAYKSLILHNTPFLFFIVSQTFYFHFIFCFFSLSYYMYI